MKYSLPESADDLLIKDGKLLMRALSIYEVLRRFGHIIRLTPFRFEDFNASLLTEEQSPLLAEIHIQLLKTLMREDRVQQTWLCPPDIRDSVNIYLQLADHATWPAALRIYLSADTKENAPILEKLDEDKFRDYPYKVNLEVKLYILEHLCDQFLLSNLARDEIVNGSSNENHDSGCRLCSKSTGFFLLCEGCPAVYHLECCEPRLDKVPDEPYFCSVCRLNRVTGVSDCMEQDEKNDYLKRHEAIGVDKLGRRYWFLVRRLFVVDELEQDVRYYTKIDQFDQMFSTLAESKQEKALIESLNEQRDEIVRQMKITEDLLQAFLNSNKNEDESQARVLGQDGAHRNYTNVYSTNNLATGKHQNSERDVNRSLGNKFCMNSANSFKWFGAIDGSFTTYIVSVKTTILKFEAMIPQSFIHPCWQAQRSNWIKSVNYAVLPEDYAAALSKLENCIKPVLFKSVWYESVGFCQLFRSTLAEREELKKTDRQPRGFERREWFSHDFEMSYRLGTMVKFSSKLKPVKHQVWKQKGEEYRLTGLNGWLWWSSTLKPRPKSKPRLYRTEPYRLLCSLNNHPFVVDMINEKINSSDVIDIATNLTCNEDERILYPKKPLLQPHSLKRISKLEGLLKAKLKNPIKIGYEEPNRKIKIETSGDSTPKVIIPTESQLPTSNIEDKTIVKTPTMTNGNGNKTPLDSTKKIFFYNDNKMTGSNSINLLSIDKSQSNQQLIKKCIFAKPKLPPCHDFMTKLGKCYSILILPDLELHKLARSGGMRETKSFSYTAKQNNYVWPYGMTPRPTFRICWLYRNKLISTMQDIALQLKVIYACLRWDDLQVRPPASGHNVISTDESTVTIELLKKRDKLPYLTHSEYLIRKKVIPIEKPTKYRKVGSKKSTPSARSGLRARRQTEEDEDKGPTVEEVWVSENQLELWELKQFDERIERQNQLMRERALREEADRRRKLEEERRRKAELERRRKAEEEAKRVKLAPSSTSSTPPTANQTNSPGIAQPRSLPTTPVVRYFRTDQGQIIRLPASYLQRGTPLILRHVGPGPNQTNTYIIRPQMMQASTNVIIRPTGSTPSLQVATPVQVATTTVTKLSTPLVLTTPVTPVTPVSTPAPLSALATKTTPATPVTPIAPSTPTTPAILATPVAPIAPSIPATPATQETPVTPTTPATPTAPTTLATPSTPHATTASPSSAVASENTNQSGPNCGEEAAVSPKSNSASTTPLEAPHSVKLEPTAQSVDAQQSVGTVVNKMAHDQHAPAT